MQDIILYLLKLLEDSGEVILITRPRRWGKSLNIELQYQVNEL
jgi:hypothetical protein